MSDNSKQSSMILKNLGGISEKYIAEADPDRKPAGIKKSRIFFICAGYAAAILLLITANIPDRSDNNNYMPVITSITTADSQMTETEAVTFVSDKASETTVITENTVVIPVEETLVTNETASNESGIITDEPKENKGDNERSPEEQPAVQIPVTATEKTDEVKETVHVTAAKESENISRNQYSGTYGKNIKWQYDPGNKTLTISGSGPMEFDEEEDAFTFEKRYSWTGNVEHVVVSEGVESIGTDAFWKFASMKTVSLPDSLKLIGSDAFRNCVSLESVTIPSGVNAINSGAFMNCNSLKSVNIPEGVTKIEENTFKGCCSLKSIVIPESVTTIDDSAFSNCLTLREAVIYGRSVNFGAGVFDSAEDNSMLVIKGYENTCRYAEQHSLEFEQIEE